MKRILMASMIAAVMASAPSIAATTAAKPVVAESAAAKQQIAEAMKIAEQGMYGMRDVQLARLALFQGEPESAKKLLTEAAALFADDSTDWKKFANADKKPALKGDQYVVINGSMGISEGYVATPEKQAAIKKANAKLAKGDKKGAIEELRLADISVVENLYLMPLKQTQKAVADAQKLLGESKYYEANLVLKSAEDSIIIDSAAVIAD